MSVLQGRAGRNAMACLKSVAANSGEAAMFAEFVFTPEQAI
jgi:hypothetical protein